MNLPKLASPKTRPVGDGKVNRSVTLPLAADAILSRMATTGREAVNVMLRRQIAVGAKAEGHPLARSLRSALGIATMFTAIAPMERGAAIEADMERLVARMIQPVNGDELATDCVAEFAEVGL